MNVALGVESASKTGIIVTYAERAERVIGPSSGWADRRGDGRDEASHPRKADGSLGERKMLTHGSRYSLRASRALGGILTVALSFVAPTVGEVVVPPGGWTLRPGCGDDCELLYVSGDAYDYQPPVVASPTGTTYSVHHRVGGDPDGNGPLPITCFYIPTLPGAPDDVVNFDGVPEAIRTNIFGTVPTVDESDDALPNGRREITILTRSQTGTDLFPIGFIAPGGVPLTDACFAIGLVDALTWVGLDTIITATIEFLTNDVVVAGPYDAISFFLDPWNGVVEITLPDGAGNGFNGVRLSLVTEKSIVVANDGCRGQIPVTNGDTAFSTIGATTDGPDEPTACYFLGYSDIGSDIWYRYTATCTGNLTVDLCNSNYDTKVAVYNSPTCSVISDCPAASPPLDCNDDFQPCGIHSYATVPVVTGQCLTIRIGGYLGIQGTGTMRLNCSIIPPPSGACCDDGVCLGTMTEVECQNRNGTWFQGPGVSCPSFSCPVTPPPNDLCANCIRVETGVAYQGRTRAATGTDISSCADNDTKDVWNCWTADCTGRVSITTCGSDFDTTLAVYTACGGTQLKCDDDGCLPTTRSKVTLDVTEGTTYTIRVSGFNLAVGNYKLMVEDCKNACCLPNGVCGLATPSVCEASPLFGTSVGPGSLCGVCVGGPNNGRKCDSALDCFGSVCDKDLDDNGINDACEPCPATTIAGAAPPSGTVDARQPNSATALLPRQGIGSPGASGSPSESIVIVLNPRLPDAEGCFRLCETNVDPILDENSVSAVTYHGAGVYELVLHHAIATGGVTTIEYLRDGSFIEYIAQPANVDGVAYVDALDVGEHVDCCLGGPSDPCPEGPVWGSYSCDIDHSGLVTPSDTLGVIDLMNGTQLWEPWFGELLPDRGTTCPLP